MKKLMLLTVIAFSSMSTYAISTPAATHVQSVVNVQNDYTEVSVEAVPAAIKTALQTAYPGVKLEKAYVNEKKEYKLDISVGDQKATVYSDVNGNWLKI
jgi:hypothetical protein